MHKINISGNVCPLLLFYTEKQMDNFHLELTNVSKSVLRKVNHSKVKIRISSKDKEKWLSFPGGTNSLLHLFP